jgi:hypothetical protein
MRHVLCRLLVDCNSVQCLSNECAVPIASNVTVGSNVVIGASGSGTTLIGGAVQQAGVSASTTAPTPAASPSDATQSFALATWLASLNMSQYHDKFIDNGFEEHDSELVADLSNADLESMGITMLAHRKKILMAAAKLKQ